MKAECYPMKLVPVLKDYIWGGTKLKTSFNKKTELPRVAESWELSCHKDGESMIANGPQQGLTLSQYIKGAGNSVLGTACESFDRFPMLVKLIDAADNLSVQVHPDDPFALVHEGEYGKTEMWYVIDCEENARLFYGFNRNISKKEFREKIESQTILEVLRSVAVKKGDVFFIRAGTIHAIGKGIVLAEVQENSNSTYRVYDYGRMGADGNPRELQIEKALDVTILEPSITDKKVYASNVFEGYTSTRLEDCKYFTVDLLDVCGHASFFADEKSFQTLVCMDGELNLYFNDIILNITKGETVFIPAMIGSYILAGKGQMLSVHC